MCIPGNVICCSYEYVAVAAGMHVDVDVDYPLQLLREHPNPEVMDHLRLGSRDCYHLLETRLHTSRN
jgi:hypothetical protein